MNTYFIAIGYLVTFIGSIIVIATIGSFALDSIIKFTRFGKEFYKYLEWRRKENVAIKTSRVQKLGGAE
jgi:hypothetical protein